MSRQIPRQEQKEEEETGHEIGESNRDIENEQTESTERKTTRREKKT